MEKQMKKKWTESTPGKKSAIRIMVVPGFYAGLILAFAGAAGILFSDKLNAVQLLWGGLTLSGACLTGKNIQKRYETNSQTLEMESFGK